MNKLDSKITCGSEYQGLLRELIESKNTESISFVNPFSYDLLLNNPELIEGIGYYFSDGVLLTKLHSFFFQKITRASFDYSSIADQTFRVLEDLRLPVAFVGAKQSEIEIAVNNIKHDYSKLVVGYYRNGYISGKYSEVLERIISSKVRVVVLGMGCPYQEDFACFLMKYSPKPLLVITCGGFLTQTSISRQYYHPLVKNTGLRWLQRAILHKHVRQRLFKEYPKFIFLYFKRQIQK